MTEMSVMGCYHVSGRAFYIHFIFISGSLTCFAWFSTIIRTIKREVSQGMRCNEFVWCGNMVRPDSTEWDILGYPWANSSLPCSNPTLPCVRRFGSCVLWLCRLQEFYPFEHGIFPYFAWIWIGTCWSLCSRSSVAWAAFFSHSKVS